MHEDRCPYYQPFRDELDEAEEAGGRDDMGVRLVGKGVLDRQRQAMTFFAAGCGEALRRFLVEEGVGRESRFFRLARALSALYPSSTDEKPWANGVLAQKKGLRL